VRARRGTDVLPLVMFVGTASVVPGGVPAVGKEVSRQDFSGVVLGDWRELLGSGCIMLQQRHSVQWSGPQILPAADTVGRHASDCTPHSVVLYTFLL
jgi:hypothetical protein